MKSVMEIRSALKGYFDDAYGRTLGVDKANDLIKEIEKMPKEQVGTELKALKSHLTDVVMLGSSHE